MRDYKKLIKALQKKGLSFDKGLSAEEVIKIEALYDIRFPDSMKSFYSVALPISDGFYNWRDFDENNIETIKTMIYCTKEALYSDTDQCGEFTRQDIEDAPTLIPIFAHRYMPIGICDSPPVLSVHGADVIYYGKDLYEYFQIEFLGKSQKDIDFDTIQYVLFWSDLM